MTITKSSYGLIVGESVIAISYCPFCGSKLKKDPIIKKESIYDIEDPVYGCYGNREGLTYRNGEWVEDPIIKKESIYDIEDPVYGCYGTREGLIYRNGEWVEKDD